MKHHGKCWWVIAGKLDLVLDERSVVVTAELVRLSQDRRFGTLRKPSDRLLCR